MKLFSIGRVILSSLFKKESTASYPGAPMKKDPLVRGRVDIDIDTCIFCGLCSRKCPSDAIVVNKQEKTWEISRFQCIVCSSCAEACPKKCIVMKPELTPASDEKTKDVVKYARVSADD